MMDVSQKVRIAEIVTFFSFENFQNSLKARFASLCCVCCLKLFAVLFFVFGFFVDRQSKIGDRKLESWTLGHIEDCSLFFICFDDLYDFFECSRKCDAASTVLHAFHKILKLLYF